MNRRIRLDVALEQRGLMPSRARARDAILRGTVSLNGLVANRPATPVGTADEIAVADPAAGYVSRAALKLIAGLNAAAIDVAGRICLDIGASTGGFTQVLLERGARKVYAVDVGHGQLDPRIATDSRVVVLEGTDARSLTADLLPDPIDLLTCDVSFVSATKVLAAPLARSTAGAHAIVLIKPQFEVGREHVGKGGIVSDAAAVMRAEAGVVGYLRQSGWRHIVSVTSPIAGGDGNRELLAAFHRD